jgi:hypothetical protein
MLVALLLTGIALGQGPIDVNETGLHDSESIYGIDGTDFSTPWTNSTIITLLGWGETDPNLYSDVAFYAYGINSFSSLTNLAAINVDGVGGNALGIEGSASAFVHAYGIFAESEGSVNITNSGGITVAARGGTAESDTGTADAYALAYGISAHGNLTNSGAIDVLAVGGNAVADDYSGFADAFGRAYGLFSSGSVLNSADITASSAGGDAFSNGTGGYYSGVQAHAETFGIYAYYGVENSGTLTVLATAGNAQASGSFADARANAYGIYSFFGQVNNTGSVNVTAVGGTADSEGEAFAEATAYGIRTADGVVNDGSITVTATAQPGFESYAHGIHIDHGEGINAVTNTGTIRAFGDNAYELFIAGGTTWIVDTYNVTLDGDPDTPSIFVDNGATLNLNNAALTVTEVVGSDPGATLWDTQYRLFGVAGNGSVAGSFSSVAAINPDVTAYYYTQGTGNAADDTVALSYEPQHSETLASATVQRRMVGMAPYAINQHMTSDLMYDMLALDELDDSTPDDAGGDTAQGLTACQRSGGAFLQPHYSYIKRDDDPLGYNAGMTGVSGGYSQCVNSSLLGLHVGYGKANIDYTGAGYSANTEDQGVVTSGFSGMTRWRPWLLRYGFSGFHGWHDYRGLTGLGLTESESASYDSYGGTGLVMVGRTFKKKKHVFLPEIGANWLWVHRESYTTEATDPAWDTTYSTLDEHDVWAQAALHWQSLYRYKKLQITPAASVALHQLLTDGESEIWQSIPGAARVQVEDEMDETAVALATSVVIRSRRTAVTLAYDGEYSSDIEQHNFWVKCRLRF